MTSVAVRRLTVQDYHRMAEAGIFSPDERVELLDGNLISMAAKGTAHSSATTRTRRVLEQRLSRCVTVRVQDPVQLDDYSEPEPDIVIAALDQLEYADHHPQSSEIFLLIEVAGAQRSPDVAWIATARWEALTPEQRRKFPPIAPDFVIELRSATDSLSDLQSKMQEYLDNQVRLGWLIDPQNQQVEIYRLGQAKEVRSLPTMLSGEDVLPEFSLCVEAF